MAGRTYHSRMDVGGPRVAVAIAAALLGLLSVIAVTQPLQRSRGLRRLELADLVRAEDGRVRALRDEVGRLRAELARAEEETGALGEDAARLRARTEELSVAAGTAGVEGPGLVVTLDDSQASRSPTGDPNDLVVHERDLQTVVNALWAAGAEAVAVNGERLTAASAVRCAGNTLLLHGTLHSPPYEVAGIGDPAALAQRLDAQPGIDRLHAAVEAYGLVYEVRPAEVSVAGGPAPALAGVARPRTVTA